MSEIVISARDLQKTWHAQTVLDRVDLDLKRGCVTAVLGPSGTGKSTLLRVIAGLETVDAGRVSGPDRILTDRSIKVLPEHRNIGLVFQDSSLFPHLSVLANAEFGLRTGSKAIRRETAMAQLASVQMDSKAHAYPHTLSGGEQQRVALARALAPQPDVVLLDEAFSGLDAKLRSTLRETALTALKESGAAVLVVTHDAEEAMFMADELALMVDGEIIQTGSPDQVYLHPSSLAAAQILGEVNHWAGVVSENHLASPFGIFKTTGKADGCNASLLLRPEALLLTPHDKGNFEVVESRPLGAQVAMKVKSPTGEIWQSRMPIDKHVAPKTLVEIHFKDELVSII